MVQLMSGRKDWSGKLCLAGGSHLLCASREGKTRQILQLVRVQSQSVEVAERVPSLAPLALLRLHSPEENKPRR